ncbi:MAG TPA: hypothetical protein VMD91_12800 [Candidatus Sulfotelmatobacter sp.]|nr:hypothetical protein [Candidatus Sulfotelmatobacter sp.]
MNQIVELLRLPSPTPTPQALAFDGARLWVGSRDTHRILSIDPAEWTARDEGEAPNVPWGMTAVAEEFRVIAGDADGDRFVHRFVPGHGFATEGTFRAPDGTGSQLSWDGDVLYISQWYKQQFVGVDADGDVLGVTKAPHQICGQTIVDGCFYAVTTDDEESGVYWLTRVDARGAEPVASDLAIIPFPARALAFDGERFWTNHRAADQIVAFERPD